MPHEHDEQSWPSDLVDAAAVRAWIASVLPEPGPVSGPIRVYQTKEWGVTASFAALGTGGARELVFKAELLRQFAGSARTAELLSRACAGMVPELLAWAPHDAGNWALFAAFDSCSAAENVSLDTLCDVAQILAQIQVTVASLPSDERALLPCLEVHRIPDLYEAVIRDVRDRQSAFWTGEGRELAEQFALPVDPPATLAQFRSSIDSWTAELLAGGWPDSIDHVDLHSENIALKPDGGILIYDWEEANLSCPFFSLDRLLDDTREWEATDESPRGPAGQLPYTSSERLVRDAYLAQIPWGSVADRERGFDLAMCLAPIKTAYEAILFGDALGWEEGSPHIIAWTLGRALPRWRAMLSG